MGEELGMDGELVVGEGYDLVLVKEGDVWD